MFKERALAAEQRGDGNDGTRAAGGLEGCLVLETPAVVLIISSR